MGVIGALAGLALTFLADLFTFIFLKLIGGFNIIKAPGEPDFFGLIKFSFSFYQFPPLIAIIGGLIMGYIIYTVSPEVCGSGLDAVIGSFHKRDKIRARVPFFKTISSAFTIGIGGSVGKEGPAAQIGGGLAYYLSEKFKLSRRDSELLLLTGAAACLSAVFKSPFGAAFFTIEVLYLRDYEVEAFIPCIISSFISYILYCSVVGWSTIFNSPVYFFIPSELPFFIVLGIICGVLGICFVSIFQTLKNKFFSVIKASDKFKPALGMVFPALCFILFPYAVSTGYGYIQLLINNIYVFPLQILAIFIVVKMFATAFTVTSGNSGGDFAPSLVIGGLIGALIARIFQQFFPSLIIQPSIFIVIGMGSFISAVTKTPIASIIIVSEMTASYTVLAPAILASFIAYIISSKWSLYDNQVINRTYSYSHLSEIMCDILSHINVRKIMTSHFHKVSGELTVREFEELAKEFKEQACPVIDENDEIIGVIIVNAAFTLPAELKSTTRLKELAVKEFPLLTIDENLKEALHKLIVSNIDMLPVVDSKNHKKVLGMISREDIEKILNL
ncbi:MAG: chloride channel protein [Candidatus Odinarchaeum yellowstonii]|uniref:Chloride channel protein n=1 Tax=Odinarchaeota yellowstonii (strain LCB_4) TaxID=1841599 RepID=A0AAF0IBC4_ODILC|nr:MAG: chloride channel protein [Candidatus Odinarchaeum yellowstonii]